ncbi:translation protein SH3-like domain-containing protein [Mycena rebaudengoi]|nr:translation protein SH3-like domain-containing protein [Mycena rebaudengoi]
MKFNDGSFVCRLHCILLTLVPDISSSRRKSRKAHFSTPSSIRRKIMWPRSSGQSTMSVPFPVHSNKFSSLLQTCSLPIRKGDEVRIVWGKYMGREGKATQVYRKKWVIHVDRVQPDKSNGGTALIGVHPSNVVITTIKLDKDRRAILDRKDHKKTVSEDVEMIDIHPISFVDKPHLTPFAVIVSYAARPSFPTCSTCCSHSAAAGSTRPFTTSRSSSSCAICAACSASPSSVVCGMGKPQVDPGHTGPGPAYTIPV